MPPRRRLRLLAAACCLAVAAACGGGDDDAEPVTSTTASTSTSTSTTTTTSLPAGARAPLTGEPIDEETKTLLAARSAVVVKIGNNDGKSLPQTGLAEADLVYEEHIEGQKTRFATVFHTEIPSQIGPVRSGRLSDIHLVDDLGTPLLAYSGGNPTVLREFLASFDEGTFIDIGELRLESLYFRSDERRRPDNLYFATDELDVSQGARPAPMFSYGTLPAGMGVEAGGVEVRYPTSFGRVSTHVWDDEAAGWVRIQDGDLHTTLSGDTEVEIAPPNVVVAVVPYVVSEADPTQSPRAESFGSGPVFVFTQGRRVDGTWTRTADLTGWELLAPDGSVIPLTPGATWVLLAAAEDSAFGDAEVTMLEPAPSTEVLTAARRSFAESSAE